jgi:N-acetyl-alpha-D-muramate 1-phosphate uridylyltransferase
VSLPVAILAGGLATRLRPITSAIPKALVEIDGTPFAVLQADLLARQKISRVIWLIGYRGEQIEATLGDGSRWAMQFDYLYDGPVLLGTGGAIKRARPRLGNAFFVMYGDSYLECDFRAVEEAFRDSGQAALMTVFCNDGLFDTSNVEFADGRIVRYDKQTLTSAMHHIDYGLGVFTPQVFDAFPDAAPFDLATVYQDLLSRGELAAFEVDRRFYEIGSPEGLSATERHIREMRRSSNRS